MNNVTTTNYLVENTSIPSCKYRLPCGMCDITKKPCKLTMKKENISKQKDENTLDTDDNTNEQIDFDNIKKLYDDGMTKRLATSNIPPVCVNCPNHPSNGGSGICHCILGGTRVTC